jgi:hypothetical protein
MKGYVMTIFAAFLVGLLAGVIGTLLAPKKKKETMHAFVIPEEVLKLIQASADKYRITRSEMMQKWIKLGIIIAELDEECEEGIILESVNLHTGELMRQKLRMK